MANSWKPAGTPTSYRSFGLPFEAPLCPLVIWAVLAGAEKDTFGLEDPVFGGVLPQRCLTPASVFRLRRFWPPPRGPPSRLVPRVRRVRLRQVARTPPRARASSCSPGRTSGPGSQPPTGRRETRTSSFASSRSASARIFFPRSPRVSGESDWGRQGIARPLIW